MMMMIFRFCGHIVHGIFKLQGTQVLEKGFTPDGSGPGALNLFSAQLFSFRWSASNDSEAFDDAVATMVHSSQFSQSDDSQLKFKFRNDATEDRSFRSYRTYWEAMPYSLGGAADEQPKRGSISRNRRDETRLRGCWFRGAA